MALRRRLGLVIFIVLMGSVIGGLLGELFSLFLPEGPVKAFLTKYIRIGFSPIHMDLRILTLTFGFFIRFNFLSILFIITLSYLLRWVY